MSFIDYIAEYFRGPQGEPGPAGSGSEVYAKEVRVPADTLPDLSGSTATPRRWFLEVGPDSAEGYEDVAISGGYKFNMNGSMIPRVVSSTPFNSTNWLFEGTVEPEFTGALDEEIVFTVFFVRRPTA